MLKIKLQRIGKKNQPRYRIVVQEAQTKVNGSYIDLLGHYNPEKKDSEKFELDSKKYKEWLQKGTKPTKTVRQLAKNTK